MKEWNEAKVARVCRIIWWMFLPALIVCIILGSRTGQAAAALPAETTETSDAAAFGIETPSAVILPVISFLICILGTRLTGAAFNRDSPLFGFFHRVLPFWRNRPEPGVIAMFVCGLTLATMPVVLGLVLRQTFEGILIWALMVGLSLLGWLVSKPSDC